MPDHKNPADRSHMWHRPAREDETAVVAATSEYAHQVPRYLHKGGEEKLVSTPDACDAALADGWTIVPEVPKVAKVPEVAHKKK